MATTYNNLYLDVRRQLKAAGVESAQLEARELVCYAADKTREQFFRDLPLYASKEVEEKVEELTQRRLAGEPVAYIIGEWEFYGLPLDISRDVIIPRADTETVAEAAIEAAREAGPGAAVADLCSGTGAIALGVATHVPGARVTAVELSPDALAYLRANNAACGCPLCVVQADVLRWQEECAPGSFDVIVSNPPYIAPEEMAGLQPELFHEPRMALEAPDGGLAFYKHIAPAYFGALKPGGRLILEIGWRQADAVCALCLSAGYEDVSVRSDLSGNPRCVLARRPIAF